MKPGITRWNTEPFRCRGMAIRSLELELGLASLDVDLHIPFSPVHCTRDNVIIIVIVAQP
jgi:hypothetical protein